EVLVENEVAEGILIDYKRDVYGTSDGDKKEFLKDVSSFANTAGGHLIVGMAEENGLPTEPIGLDADLDKELLRLESLLRDRLEPRIVGIRMKAVPLGNGRRALVIRIPKSWNAPHAVLHNKSRLIFARNSAGAHEASVDEMRTMFTAGPSLSERAHAFHRERMKIVHSDKGPLSNLAGEGGRMVLHIIPFSAFDAGSAVDLACFDPSDLTPIWCLGCNFGYNVEGYWTTSGGGDRAGYVQVFRNGIIEAAAGDVRSKTDQGWLLYAESVEDQVTTKLEKYMSALSRAEVSPPMIAMLGGVRMNGTIVVRERYAPLREAQPLTQ